MNLTVQTAQLRTGQVNYFYRQFASTFLAHLDSAGICKQSQSIFINHEMLTKSPNDMWIKNWVGLMLAINNEDSDKKKKRQKSGKYRNRKAGPVIDYVLPHPTAKERSHQLSKHAK